MRWTTNVVSPKSSSRYLPRRPTCLQRLPVGLVGRGSAVFSAVKLNGVNFVRTRPANSAVSRSACAWISGISGIIGRAPTRRSCVRARGEHGVEGAEHRLRLEQLLLVAEQQDLPADERLLGVELAGGDGDGGRPMLLHADVLVVGCAGAERGVSVAHLQVIRDVALGPVADDLGDVDLMVVGERPEMVARR